MSRRDELDGMIMLLRAMSGETNVIENMEAEGQRECVSHIKLAKKMYPSREMFEKLGFTFEEIEGDRVLVNATLPEGWSLEPTNSSYWTDILDDKGRRRAYMFYKAAFYDRDAHMDLSRRYSVHEDELEGDIREIYFGAPDEKLFVAGSVHYSWEMPREERVVAYDEKEALIAAAEAWGKENYPEYYDPTAYWDQEPGLHLKLGNKAQEKK